MTRRRIDPSQALRGLALAAGVAMTLCTGGAAYADVVRSPPTDCPDGAQGDSSHCGPLCVPWLCGGELTCGEGKSCKQTELCIQDRQCGGGRSGRSYTQQIVEGSCDAGACAFGVCRKLEVCAADATAPAGAVGGTEAGGAEDGPFSCGSTGTRAGAGAVSLLLLAGVLLGRRGARSRP